MENRRILYTNLFKKIALMLTLFTVLVSCLKRVVNNILEESESDILFEDSETFSQIKLPEFYYDNEKPYEEFIEIIDPYFNFIDNLEVIIDEETIILNDIVWKYEEIYYEKNV